MPVRVSFSNSVPDVPPNPIVKPVESLVTKPAFLPIDEFCRLLEVPTPSAASGVVIHGIATLEQATAEHASFVQREKYVEQATASKAAILIAPAGVEVPGKTVVTVPNVMAAMVRLIGHFHPDTLAQPGVHPSAVVSPTARIGSNVHLGAHVVVEDGAEIGDGAIIESHGYIGRGARVGAASHLFPRVTLLDRCVIGNRVRVHSGVVIGADGFRYEKIGGRLVKIPQVGNVVIEDDVEIGANSAIDRAFLSETRVGARTKIDNMVHIGHNVTIGSDCIIVAQVGIAGSVKLGRGVMIGGQTGVKDHVQIGDMVQIGGSSAVQNDVPSGMRLVGIPAASPRSWVAFGQFFRKFHIYWPRLKELLGEKDEGEK